jgi:hypothetical protein
MRVVAEDVYSANSYAVFAEIFCNFIQKHTLSLARLNFCWIGEAEAALFEFNPATTRAFFVSPNLATLYLLVGRERSGPVEKLFV